MKNSTAMVQSSPTKESLCQFMKNHAVDFTFLSLLFIGLLYIFIFVPSNNRPLFSFPKPQCHPSTMFNMTIYTDELNKVLDETSMPNKTLIIAIVNKAYVEGDKPMLDLFMDGFWLGEETRALKDHLLIVAVDQTAYQRCTFLQLHCYKLETDGVDFVGEKIYMSDDFIKMMWRRTLFLGDVLKRGYNFIFTDTDVLWLRNPFSRLSPNETLDLQISTDLFNGNESSEANHINTGFYMIRSNTKTIALFDAWYAKKDNSTGMKEQDVLETLMHDGAFRGLGLGVRFLDTRYFSGFCENSKDVGAVVTVHANCCRSINAKVADLTTVVHDWKRARGSRANETTAFEWSKHEACTDSWKN
ncbi:Nucleotide-diphospho-sugar transferase protein [Actinidia chinensis var. chinensis]|uniref:Nucleotide-diphospho-sugar transferase protein n=1 Tax=Actinidia chinensis var. chinensis TaxID=1590841 RepID=A0A2R6RT79_ACTCC|nr:Nucleotide-diphospho-sugar transferase protein [Actinidia chinensis var. chinensis]